MPCENRAISFSVLLWGTRIARLAQPVSVEFDVEDVDSSHHVGMQTRTFYAINCTPMLTIKIGSRLVCGSTHYWSHRRPLHFLRSPGASACDACNIPHLIIPSALSNYRKEVIRRVQPMVSPLGKHFRCLRHAEHVRCTVSNYATRLTYSL